MYIIFETLQRIKGNLRPELKMIEKDGPYPVGIFFKIPK